MRTAKPGQSKRDRLLNFALGAAGEGGEIAEKIKKHVFHEHELDEEDLVKEIGDLLWYAAGLMDAIGRKFDEAPVKNIMKLRRRYPEGFTVEESHHDGQ